MPSLTLSDRLIWFAHVPKAGGTSVERLMVATWGPAVGHLHWGWDLWWMAGGWRVADPPNSPQHLIWEDAAVRLSGPPTHVFAVVRDPATRMISEYHWQRTRRRGTRAGRLLARLPFSLWLRLMLAMARANAHAFDNHFRAQAAFIPEVATVFRFEDGLQPVADWLAEVTGRDDLTMPHDLKGRGKSVVPTTADLTRIVRAFAGDYRRFGYPLPVGTEAGPKPPSGRLSGRFSKVLSTALLEPLLWLERRGAL